MNRHIPAAFFLFLALFSSHAWAHDEPADANADHSDAYLLRYRFEMGEVLRYSVEHAVEVRVTIKETSESTKAHSESTKAWKVLDVLPSGEIEFAHVVENIHMRNESPGRAAVEYDSQKDKVPPADFKQAAAAVGVTLTVVRIQPSGKIVSYQEKHAQLGNSSDAPIVLLLPEQPVSVGAEWNDLHHVHVKLPGDAQQRVETRRHFKLVQVKNRVATIEVSYQVLSPMDAPMEAQLVGRLTEGKFRFDIDRGRILSQQQDVDKRVVGFAGPSSSMHYLSRFTERLLLENEEDLATVEGQEEIHK